MSAICYWLESSLSRVFPQTPAKSAKKIAILAARNERVSFQACLRNPTSSAVAAQVKLSADEGLDAVVRRVGYVPVSHHNTDTEQSELDGAGHIPGFVPDPLFPEDTAVLGPFETHSFWITIAIPADIHPGERTLEIEFFANEEPIGKAQANLAISDFAIQPQDDFPVTHWFYSDALCDWYGVEPFDERFWKIVELYIANVANHGGNCMYVPIFTPPTDGVKRPTQLLKVQPLSNSKYAFDFADVKRWVNLARENGAKFFEWTHLFSQWGVQNAIRVYQSNQDENSLLWQPETPAVSDVYRNFLSQFLPEFKKFLDAEGLLDMSIFHLSDEPHGDEHLENYRKARALLKELAPWMRVADAMSDIRYGIEGLTDIPIPSIRMAKEYFDNNIPAMVYFCCGPRGKFLNRLMDTPLAKIRMSGWLFHRFDAKGFLHWGYNYWYKSQTRKLINPFTESSGEAWPNWAYGDTFAVYPGENGPIDSIRWEIFSESLQDFALLRTAGICRDDKVLAEILNYDDFPKTEEWIVSARKRVLG